MTARSAIDGATATRHWERATPEQRQRARAHVELVGLGLTAADADAWLDQVEARISTTSGGK